MVSSGSSLVPRPIQSRGLNRPGTRLFRKLEVPLCFILLGTAGESLDVMKRGILCASSSQLASQLVPAIRHLDYPTSQKD